jgi:hypothetical protein
MWIQPLPGFQEPSALPADILEALDCFELDPLVNRESRAWAVELAAQYPLPARMLCFECRLAEARSTADFAICLGPAFDHYLSPANRTAILRGQPCVPFLQEWGDPEKDLLRDVPFVCLAFDADAVDSIHNPCLSVCIDRELTAKLYGLQGKAPDPQASESLILRCYKLAQGRPMTAATLAVLRRYLQAQPEIEFRHVSFMHARRPAAFKLDVRLPAKTLPHFLQQISWPSPPSGLETMLTWLARPHAKVQVNLTIEPLIGSHLEVEIVPAPGGDDLAARVTAIDNLVRLRLCAPQKGEFLKRTLHDPLIEGANGNFVALNHYTKVRFTSAGLCDAKAYLAIIPQTPRRTQLSAMEPRHGSRDYLEATVA